MNFISTNEAAEKWKLSARRISMLASGGRIPGAVLVGNSWLIPSDAQKPADGRRRSAHSLNERYIFPIPMAVLCNSCTVDDFSEEERRLYEASVLFEVGDVEGCLSIARQLFKASGSRYIRIGALYVMYSAALLLHSFDDIPGTVFALHREFSLLEDHRDEIALIVHEVNSYEGNWEWYENDFSIDPSCQLSDAAQAYISVMSVGRDLSALFKNKMPVNTLPYELICFRLEADGYFYSAMFMNQHLSLLCGISGSAEAERFHLKRAIDLCVEHGIYNSFSMVASFAPEMTISLLDEYPAEVKEKIVGLIQLNLQARAAYLSSSGRTAVFSKLSPDDYLLISLCLRNYSVEKLAAKQGVSVSAAKRRLTELYKKLDVSSKKELVEVYSSAVFLK